MPAEPEPPAVSIILAVLNEADFIDEVLADLLGQDYEGSLEVVVADGGSTDGTGERLDLWVQRDKRVAVIANPRRGQAYGLNAAAERASGDILVRADGHTRFAPDYVSQSIEVLQETGGAVGGRMNPVGRTAFGRAIAAAMKSPLTMGPGRFHHATIREEVDTVYLGAFLRRRFEALGGFRAFPSGSSEDADFYYRWRKAGGKVYVDPDIVSTYTPRDDLGSLWQQYLRYGKGKSEMLWLNGRLPSLRPLAPMVLVLGLFVLILVGVLTGTWWPFLALSGVWLLLLAWVGLRSDEQALGVFSVSFVMHVGYGVGVLWGLIKGPGGIRRLSERWSSEVHPG